MGCDMEWEPLLTKKESLVIQENGIKVQDMAR